MALKHPNPVWYIVKGMTYYVSRLYKSENFDETTEDIEVEDLNLPTRLKIVLSDALDNFKNEIFVKAHNHYVDLEDRETQLLGTFRSGLLEIATDKQHLFFLRECTLYIMSATFIERLGFPEAINIVMEAIYYACINSVQQNHLAQWNTEEGYIPVIEYLNNGNDQHNNEARRNIDVQPNQEARHDVVQSNQEARHDVVQSNQEARHDVVQSNQEARHDVVQRNREAWHDDVQRNQEARQIDDQPNNETRQADNDDSEKDILLDYDSREVIDLTE